MAHFKHFKLFVYSNYPPPLRQQKLFFSRYSDFKDIVSDCGLLSYLAVCKLLLSVYLKHFVRSLLYYLSSHSLYIPMYVSEMVKQPCTQIMGIDANPPSPLGVDRQTDYIVQNLLDSRVVFSAPHSTLTTKNTLIA